MKNRFVLLIVFVLILPSFSSFAQEMDMQEMMKVWMEYMTPGQMHEMLAKNIGTWNTSTTFWNYPGAEPATSEGTAVMESILGGRFFKTVHHSTVMGMPMEGWSIDGYDNGKKVFMSIWIDNMGTGLAQSFGSYDNATSTFNHIGTMYDAMADRDVEFRSVTKMIGENKMIFEMYADFQGQEFKMMEMVYTR